MRLVRMNEEATIKNGSPIRTHSMNGCTACIIQGKEETFFQHTSSNSMKTECEKWNRLFKELEGTSIIIYLSLFHTEDGELPWSDSFSKGILKYLEEDVQSCLEFVFYDIDGDSTEECEIKLENGEFSTTLKIV